MRNSAILIACGFVLQLLTGGASAQTQPATRPVLHGIAEKYSNDAGIEKDPAVIFADNFDATEAGTVSGRPIVDTAASAPSAASTVASRPATQPSLAGWDGRHGKGSVRIVPGQVVQDGRELPGKNVLQLGCWGGVESAAGITKLLGNYQSPKQGKGPGLEEVFIRYYQRLDEGYVSQPNHGANVGGRDVTRPGSWWVGQAGIRDVASKGYFYSGLQPYAMGKGGGMYWGFYSYHLDKRDAWGDNYRPVADEKPEAKVGRWYCLERRLKLNSVDPLKADGLEELWVDGKLAIRREGLRFRNVAEVRIEVLNLEMYYHKVLPQYDQQNPVTVSYDNVVISKSYIGPIVPGTATK